MQNFKLVKKCILFVSFIKRSAFIKDSDRTLYILDDTDSL